MSDPQPQMPFDKLIESIVERVFPEIEKRIKRGNEMSHDSEDGFSFEERKDLREMIKESKKQQYVVNGLIAVVSMMLIPFIYGVIGQVKTNAQSEASITQINKSVDEVKASVAKIEESGAKSIDAVNKSVEATNKSVTALNNWRARFKYAKDKNGLVYIYPDTEEPQ